MLSSTPSEQILRTKRGKRNLIRGVRGNIHISPWDREFNSLVMKPLVNAFSQFMLDQILNNVVANAANEGEIERELDEAWNKSNERCRISEQYRNSCQGIIGLVDQNVR